MMESNADESILDDVSTASEEDLLLCALRAVFERDEGELFCRVVSQRISDSEAVMINTAKRHNLKVEKGVEDLLAVQSSMNDMHEQLQRAQADARAHSAAVSERAAELADVQLVVSNIADTLQVLRTAKRVVTLFREAQRCVMSGQLHVALRIVSVMNAQLLCMSKHQTLESNHDRRDPTPAYGSRKPGNISSISNLLPDPARIEALVVRRCDALFEQWAEYAHSRHGEIGRAALSHPCQAWIPEVFMSDSSRPQSEIDSPRDSKVIAPELEIALAPLLRVVLLCHEMGREKAFAVQYCNERTAQLEETLRSFTRAVEDPADVNIGVGGGMRVDSVKQSIVEVVGWFVLELAIERSVRNPLLSLAEIKEFWTHAEETIASVVKQWTTKSDLSAVAKSKMRDMFVEAAQCMHEYGFDVSHITSALGDRARL